VTSPLLPELVTEGESIDEVLVNVRDAFDATRELYDDLGKKLHHHDILESTEQTHYLYLYLQDYG